MKSKSFRIKHTNSCTGEPARFSSISAVATRGFSSGTTTASINTRTRACASYKRLRMRWPPQGNTHKVRPLMQSEAQLSHKRTDSVLFFFFFSMNPSARGLWSKDGRSSEEVSATPCADLWASRTHFDLMAWQAETQEWED